METEASARVIDYATSATDRPLRRILVMSVIGALVALSAGGYFAWQASTAYSFYLRTSGRASEHFNNPYPMMFGTQLVAWGLGCVCCLVQFIAAVLLASRCSTGFYLLRAWAWCMLGYAVAVVCVVPTVQLYGILQILRAWEKNSTIPVDRAAALYGTTAAVQAIVCVYPVLVLLLLKPVRLARWLR
ncbi:MAG: hypothetical protein QM770_24590 [Tepidisphaeraceae bacterium]